jgi:hypothetical protein
MPQFNQIVGTNVGGPFPRRSEYALNLKACVADALSVAALVAHSAFAKGKVGTFDMGGLDTVASSTTP